MPADNIKILFCGISEKYQKIIKNSLSGMDLDFEFCIFNEINDALIKFSPDIIVTAISSSIANYQEIIFSLKNISSRTGIPFAVAVNKSHEEPYLFLLENSILNIITLPLHRHDFTGYISRFLGSINELNPAPVPCGVTEDILISNLVIQNRILKEHLKKVQSDDEFEKIHFEKVNELRIEEQKLWDAYNNGYFKLFYQPVIFLETGNLAGFEALIRIIHPEDGLISPDVFIPVAENSAIIFPLGLWIIEEACRQINEWKNSFVFDYPIRINVNLSAKQFIHPELISNIFEITERLNISGDDIAFELTESAFMEDMESANIALLELKSKKFTLYMDDFGTGYSSLSYLMHFPVNVIKIDQSFVKWMHIDEQSETLVKSIVMLAHNLGLKVVAEGTDDESHIELLRECGCDYAQGYYFAKPMPAVDAARFISDYFKEK